MNEEMNMTPPQGLGEEQDTKELEQLKRADEERQEVNKVVTSSNNTFEEQFQFDELDLEFTVRLKYPSMLDQAKIDAQVERYFQGLASLMPPRNIQAYRMLAIMQYQQDKYKGTQDVHVPEMFRDAEEVYNPLILLAIYDKFVAWMNSFRY